MTENYRPIGVFDSGIGGLTVVKQLIASMPNEDIIYFGDTARVPYGSKSNETVIEYSKQNTRLLLREGVKAIVVACNTASSMAIPTLRQEFDLPIIGVIEPGAKIANETTSNGKIGVVGTRATIGNKAYSKELNKLNKKLKVFEKTCPLFVPLAEEGWTEHQATKIIAEEYLKELKEQDIDTLILGCTHYPLLAKVINQVMGENVELIDSGVATAKIVTDRLDSVSLLTDRNSLGSHKYYVSDVPSQFKILAERFLGREIENIKKVDIEILQSL